MRVLINLLFSFVLLGALSACSQVPAIEEAPSTEFAAEGLHPVSASGFTAAYALPGADLPACRKVHIEALELGNIATGTTTVNATLRRDWQMTPEREAALQQVDILRQQDATNPNYLILKGSVLVRQGEHRAALAIYEKILADYPDQAPAQLNYGHALKTVGRVDAAVAAYRKSIELKLTIGEAYWSLANLKTYRFSDA